MFHKKDLTVVRKTHKSEFSENYIVYYTPHKQLNNRIYFDMRVASKNEIVVRREQSIVHEEWKIRCKIRCHFLVNVVSTFQDSKYLYYVTELPLGGFLYYYLRKSVTFDISVARFLLAEMLLGLQYLHAKGLVYRLLIPENVMITETGHVKLRFDFMNCLGLAQEKYEKLIEYIPFDYLYNEESTSASDYWSLGILLYEMLVGQTPFKGDNYETTRKNILSQNISIPSKVDKDAGHLINQLLNRVVTQRLGYNQGDRFTIRNHPFFSNINWAELASLKMRSPLEVCNDPIFGKEDEIKLSEMHMNEIKNQAGDGYGSAFKYYGLRKDRIE